MISKGWCAFEIVLPVVVSHLCGLFQLCGATVWRVLIVCWNRVAFQLCGSICVVCSTWCGATVWLVLLGEVQSVWLVLLAVVCSTWCSAVTDAIKIEAPNTDCHKDPGG